MAEQAESSRRDFESEDFDPEETLLNPDAVSLAFPDVQALPRLNDCLRFFPPALREELEAGLWLQDGRKKKTEEQVARDAAKKQFLQQRAAQYAIETHREAHYDAIRAIADRFQAGPHLVLKQLYFKRARVDIVLRSVAGVRGVMRATLHGFDKFFNMLLADVHEVFVTRERVVREKPKRIAAAHAGLPADGAAEGSSRASGGEAGQGGGDDAEARRDGDGGAYTVGVQLRVGWKQVLKQRRIARSLLKGDHVVMVYRASGVIKLPGSLGLRFNHLIEQATT